MFRHFMALVISLQMLVLPAHADDLSPEDIIEITVMFQGFGYVGETEYSLADGTKSKNISIRTEAIEAVIDQGENRYRVITQAINGVDFKRSDGTGVEAGQWTSMYEILVSFAEGDRVFVETVKYLKTLDGDALVQPNFDEYRDITIEEDFMFSAAKVQWERSKNQ